MSTWKATTAAILELVAGALHLVAGVLIMLVSGALAAGLEIAGLSDISATLPMPVAVFIGIPVLLLGVLALVGGICALRRKRWGLTLLGAICSMPPLAGTLGIAAIVLVVLSREEFE